MPTKPPIFRPAHIKSRPDQLKIYEAERREREPWRNWYKLKVWLDARAAQLAQEPLCETHLLQYDEIKPANVVHHREPHRGDWAKFIDQDNLASVCKECHDGEIQRGERTGWTDRGWEIEGHKIPARVVQPLGLEPSAIPLTMVCGPPGAGKSTYINARRGPDDVVIDIDMILRDLSGTESRTRERRDRYLLDAFVERNKRLAALATETRPIAAWFIIGAPGPTVRRAWSDQLKPNNIVVMETPAAVCRSRIMAEPTRAETASGMVAGAFAWWERYQQASCDTLRIAA
jgi:5-methylcytosine-specific restriction protein A